MKQRKGKMGETPKDNSGISVGDSNKASAQPKVLIKGSIRWIRPYSIFPTEMKAFSVWNTIQNTAFTVAFSSWSFGIGLSLQLIFSKWEDLTPLTKAVIYLGIPISIVLGLISFFLGKYLSKSAVTLEDMIKDETQSD